MERSRVWCDLRHINPAFVVMDVRFYDKLFDIPQADLHRIIRTNFHLTPQINLPAKESGK